MEGHKGTALVVIDMINTYDHPDAELLVESVREVLPAVTRALEGARRHGTDVIYVNDNTGAGVRTTTSWWRPLSTARTRTWWSRWCPTGTRSSW